MSLDSALHANGEFRSYDEAFHAKGLLHCASMNTAMNDHLAQFVRGAHSMTAIAILLVILAALPTSFTAAAQVAEVSRTAIVGPVQVDTHSFQFGQALVDHGDTTRLNARIQLLESRISELERKRGLRKSSANSRFSPSSKLP
jgi:hypothetical protein